MLNIEKAIAEVASVYHALTGTPIKPGRSDLPPEVDPMPHVEARFHQFKALIEGKGQARPANGSGSCFSPAADVVECDREVRVHLDIPGITRDHLTVSIAADMIAVRGERPEKKLDGGIIRYKERWGGIFQKNIALPPRARRDGIDATLRDGVLTITIPTDGSGNEVSELPVDIKS